MTILSLTFSSYGLSYISPFASGSRGISATIILFSVRTIFLVSVTLPIILKSNSHFLNIFSAFSSDPGFITINILSWLSESMISNGVIFVSLTGTLSKFISIPLLSFAAISTAEEVKPAAPIS